MKLKVRRGQIRQFQGQAFLYYKGYNHMSVLVVPVTVEKKPMVTTEIECLTGKGTRIILECWNIRNITKERIAESTSAGIGRISRDDLKLIRVVVRHAFTGVKIPRHFKGSIGPKVTEKNCHEVMIHQRDRTHLSRILQLDLEGKLIFGVRWCFRRTVRAKQS